MNQIDTDYNSDLCNFQKIHYSNNETCFKLLN